MSATARVHVSVAPGSARPLTDVELMRACGRGGTAEAWDEFVRRFNRFVCLSVVRAHAQCSGRRAGQLDPETVSDLIQDVYVKLFERSRSVNGTFRGSCEAAVYVYIGRVALSVAVDAQRRNLARKRGRDLLSLDAMLGCDDDEAYTLGATLRSPDPTPEQNATASILRCEVADVLTSLLRGRNATRDLQIAEDHILDGIPLTEMAESVSGMRPGALKSSVRRTGARLRSEMARRERLATLKQTRLR